MHHLKNNERCKTFYCSFRNRNDYSGFISARGWRYCKCSLKYWCGYGLLIIWPLIRAYILKKTSPNVLANKAFAQGFYRIFEGIDVNSRTILINRLSEADGTIPEMLSTSVHPMTKNQLKTYLGYLLSLKEGVGVQSIIQNLRSVVHSRSYDHSYFINNFLSTYANTK